jgi:hypothetical protein
VHLHRHHPGSVLGIRLSMLFPCNYHKLTFSTSACFFFIALSTAVTFDYFQKLFWSGWKAQGSCEQGRDLWMIASSPKFPGVTRCHTRPAPGDICVGYERKLHHLWVGVFQGVHGLVMNIHTVVARLLCLLYLCLPGMKEGT